MAIGDKITGALISLFGGKEEEDAPPAAPLSIMATSPRAVPEGTVDYGGLTQLLQQQLIQEQTERLRESRSSRADEFLAFASGLGRPTKTGSFGESLGYANEALAKQSAESAKLRAAQRKIMLEYGVDLATLGIEQQKGLIEAAAKQEARNVAGRPKVQILPGMYPGAPPRAVSVTYDENQKPIATELPIGADGTPAGGGPAGGAPAGGAPAGATVVAAADAPVDLKKFALQTVPGTMVRGGDPDRWYYVNNAGSPSLIPQGDKPKPAMFNTPVGLLERDPETGLLTVPKATPEAQLKLDATKPLPAAVQRREDDLIGAIQTTSSQAADMRALRERIQRGDINLSLPGNVLSTAMGGVGLSNKAYTDLIDLKSSLKSMQLASLQLAKGVQTAKDAETVWNSLFGSLSDEKSMIRQLTKIEAMNRRNATLAAERINLARANNRVPPLELTSLMDYEAVTKAFPLAPRDPAQRTVGEIYLSPNNVAAKWTGQGWERVR